DYGIAMRYSNNNNLVNNTANNNNRGIYLTLTSSMNTLSENKANSNLMNGIILSNCNNNNLVGNTATLNTFSGINLANANNNNLTNNTVSLNRRGISITTSSSGNVLSGNKVNSNSGTGILLDNSGDNNLTGNTAGSNTGDGIYLLSSDNNKLDSNTVPSNNVGIYMVTSNGTTISKNTVSNSAEYGMLLSLSDSNTISRNSVSNSNRGIYLNSSKNNNVSSNNVALSSNYGLYLCAQSTSNLIFDNYLNNTINVNSKNTGCVWNKTKTSGTSIVGGPNIGGNYWANPLGIGFSQITPDANEDGIADLSYAGTNFIDYLPLVAVYVPEPVFPVADFSTNVTSGNAPLAVLFTDNSQNATSRNWNFGDGANSTEQNPKHTYLSAGNYTVNLTVSNLNGTDSKTDVITVLEEVIDVLPVADFDANVTSGNAPLAVLFTDNSQNATSRNWNFGDGDSSIEQNPKHTYLSAGNYTVNLTVSNLNGTDSKTAVITVLEEEEEEIDVLPVANFSTNVTSGYAPLSVLFTDLSENATSRSWDVNNDGIEDSNEASFVYTYTSTGTYTAKLTANNAKGPATKTILIYVDRKSSGGSSGGGGGSPESSRNIEVKELSQVFISNGKAVKFDFTKAATCVVYVGFDAKKTVGKTITTAEQLKNKSSLVSELPSGEVYKSFNLWVGNGGYATEKNIENPVICFKVEKTWIQDQNIDQSSIVLNRYNDEKWEQLPVSLVNEDDKYLYFTAKTPGFSPFAITGKANASEGTATEIQPVDESDNSEENTEDTGSETNQEPEQETSKTPGFEIVYGVAGLLAVFLYKRK
ncbi:MAG: PGF-pre-PGF domain-containing protein, partial [Methanosarcina sp.]|nr:PGF-pre-PGF domain-containing protein [Methanosarcina sp.]